MNRFRRRLHAWFAIAAMLFAAFAPAVSRAMTSGTDSLLIDVCSAGGVHFVQIPLAEAGHYLDSMLAGGGESDDSSVNSLYACPYCSSHNLGVGLPALESTVLLVAQGMRAAVPRLFLAAPRPLFTWSPASPRAPPFFA